MSTTRPREESPGPPVRIATPWRRWLHLGSAAVGWTVFLGFWSAVFVRTPPREGLRDVIVVGALFLLSATGTAIWIRHNLLLVRRLGDRRRASIDGEFRRDRDVLGRVLVVEDWDRVAAASVVEIDLNQGRGEKIYRVVRP